MILKLNCHWIYFRLNVSETVNQCDRIFFRNTFLRAFETQTTKCSVHYIPVYLSSFIHELRWEREISIQRLSPPILADVKIEFSSAHARTHTHFPACNAGWVGATNLAFILHYSSSYYGQAQKWLNLTRITMIENNRRKAYCNFC